MPNSSLITDLKSAVTKELTHDEALFHAIDSKEVNEPENADKLMYSHVFPYHRTPETLTETSTLITFQVHVRELSNWDERWISAILEFYIYSHERHMEVNNVPNVPDNRNDYIAKLLDQKFNGRSTLGNHEDPKNDVHLYDSLDLTLNEEGATPQGYPYRHVTFRTKDLNNVPRAKEGW